MICRALGATRIKVVTQKTKQSMNINTSLTFLSGLMYLTGFTQTVKFSELQSERKDRQDFKTYISADGAEYQVGDTIHILSPSKGSGEFAAITSRFKGDASFTIHPVKSALEDNHRVIESIFATAGNSQNPSTVVFHFSVDLSPENTLLYYVDIEKAIKLGEAKAFGMTSDEALSELKKAKDKLDLGILSQKEYDAVRANLVKYIKK